MSTASNMIDKGVKLLDKSSMEEKSGNFKTSIDLKNAAISCFEHAISMLKFTDKNDNVIAFLQQKIKEIQDSKKNNNNINNNAKTLTGSNNETANVVKNVEFFLANNNDIEDNFKIEDVERRVINLNPNKSILPLTNKSFFTSLENQQGTFHSSNESEIDSLIEL